MTIKTLNNQTFFDLAIQYMGSADYAMKIALANDMELTSILPTAADIIIPELDISGAEAKVVKAYSNNQTKPAGELPA